MPQSPWSACVLLCVTTTCSSLASNSLASYPQARARSRLNFDRGWKFHLGSAPNRTNIVKVPADQLSNCTAGTPCDPAYPDSNWRELVLPHDFMIEGTFNKSVNPNHGALAPNVAWYRKTFAIPVLDSPDDLVWLTFDGAYRAADVYVNGNLVRHHEEGYTSFVVYLHNATSSFIEQSETVVAVYLDATTSELWCYEGGGIYRHVWLETASALSVVPWGFAAPTTVTGQIYGTDPNAPQTTSSANLAPRIDIANARATPVTGSAVIQLRDADDIQLLSHSTPFTISAGGFTRLTPYYQGSPQSILSFGNDTYRVKLWNTAWRPPLHTASVTLMDADGTILDTVSVKIGIRSAIFSAEHGFMLNGAKVLLKGTSNHLGFGGVGNAEPDRVQEFRIATLKQMGSNAFRTAHNPVAPELLEYADQYGMLVWEENRFVTSGVQPIESTRGGPAHTYAKNRSWNADNFGWNPPTVKDADPLLLSDAQDMVIRDRNHPSIVIWSLCNELGCVAGDPNGGDLAIQFKLAIYAADTTRPITGNTVQTPYIGGNKYLDPFALAMDVQSFSYDYVSYSIYHSISPWKSVGGGESASCQADRAYYGPTNTSTGHIGMFDHGSPSMKSVPQPQPGDPLGLFPCASVAPGVSSWIIDSSASNEVTIRLKSSPSLCVTSATDMPIGKGLVLDTCSNSSHQIFKILQESADGYDIRNSKGCDCWNVDDPIARQKSHIVPPGTPVMCFNCVDSGKMGFNPNQRFTIKQDQIYAWSGYQKNHCVAIIPGAAPSPPPPPPGQGLFSCAMRSWNSVASLDFTYGNFAWTGFDYKGETSLGWPDVSSHYGIHDIAGFPKDSAGYYKAWWKNSTECGAVQISPSDWTSPVPVNSIIPVHVTTCAAAVDLFVNGVIQKPVKQPVPKFGYALWSVLFQPGNITAVAYDSDNVVVAKSTIVTALAASKLKLIIDNPYNGRNASLINADGQDVALLRVELLDEMGILVPNSDCNVSFSVTGPGTVVGTANGDPADHSPDRASWRKTNPSASNCGFYFTKRYRNSHNYSKRCWYEVGFSHPGCN